MPVLPTARGVTLTNTVDTPGRVTRTDYSATDPVTPNLRFCYDGKEYDLASDGCVAVGGRSDHARGALTHAVARKVVGGTPTLVSGTKYRNIDPLGRVLESRQTTGTLSDYTFLYQYAVGGALAKLRYPSGNWVSYDVNGANRVAKVRRGETGSSYYMQSTAYNAAGALTSATVGLNAGSQWTETRAYNSRLQARRVEVAKGASTLLRLRWAYSGSYNGTTFEETGTDNNGDLRVERLEFPHQGAMQSLDRGYAYTGADRLSAFTETGGKSQSFGHDAFGNVWQTSVSGVPALRQTGASWYLLGGGVVNNRLANTAYDAAGNQTQLSVSAGTVASYDAENRMSKIAVGAAEIASYTYDAEGRRVAKTAAGATTYYLYDAGGQLMAEYGGPAQTAGTQYFTTDSLGSTRMILDGTGGCLERLDYAPFGGQISRGYDCYGGASNEKPLFTGQLRDGESTAGTDTGQDYFNARYLWANIARFTSADAPFADQRPEDGQSWNMYAYVRNNPLRWVDPEGKAIEFIGDEEERKKQLQALQAAVGQRAGAYLYSNKIETKNNDGSITTRYYVGIYSGGPSGEGPTFASINASANDLNSVIRDSQVAQVNLVNVGEPFMYFSPTEKMTSLDSFTAGITSPYNEPGPIKVWVLDPSSANYAGLPGHAMSDGRPAQRSLITILMHELGHVAWQMDTKAGRATPRDPYGNGRSLQFENNVRKRLGGAARIVH